VKSWLVFFNLGVLHRPPALFRFEKYCSKVFDSSTWKGQELGKVYGYLNGFGKRKSSQIKKVQGIPGRVHTSVQGTGVWDCGVNPRNMSRPVGLQ
jgi:hypothetical protein